MLIFGLIFSFWLVSIVCYVIRVKIWKCYFWLRELYCLLMCLWILRSGNVFWSWLVLEICCLRMCFNWLGISEIFCRFGLSWSLMCLVEEGLCGSLCCWGMEIEWIMKSFLVVNMLVFFLWMFVFGEWICIFICSL